MISVAVTEKGKQTMNEPYFPFRIKYKGYTITQKLGEVIISDRKRHEVLTIPTQRQRTHKELAELFEFNARIYGFDKGSG